MRCIMLAFLIEIMEVKGYMSNTTKGRRLIIVTKTSDVYVTPTYVDAERISKGNKYLVIAIDRDDTTHLETINRDDLRLYWLRDMETGYIEAWSNELEYDGGVLSIGDEETAEIENELMHYMRGIIVA